MTTYSEFTRRLVERFDRRDLEAPFMSLAKLKQSGNIESYISEFLRLAIMVPDLSVARRVYMFIDGLDETLHGLVKSTKPTTLHDAIERARDLQDALPKARKIFIISPLFLQRERKKNLLLPRRAHTRSLLMMKFREI